MLHAVDRAANHAQVPSQTRIGGVFSFIQVSLPWENEREGMAALPPDVDWGDRVCGRTPAVKLGLLRQTLARSDGRVTREPQKDASDAY